MHKIIPLQGHPVHKTWLKNYPRVRRLSGVIFHSNNGHSFESSIQHLRQKGYAYHYGVERKGGIIWKCAPTSRSVSHAGSSKGWSGPWCNTYTLGICIACFDSLGQGHTDSQIEGCLELLKTLKAAYPDLDFISRHRDVSPGRKTDPLTFDHDVMSFLAAKSGMTFWRPVRS